MKIEGALVEPGFVFQVAIKVNDGHYYDILHFRAKAVSVENNLRLIEIISEDGTTTDVFNLEKVSQMTIIKIKKEELENGK